MSCCEIRSVFCFSLTFALVRCRCGDFSVRRFSDNVNARVFTSVGRCVHTATVGNCCRLLYFHQDKWRTTLTYWPSRDVQWHNNIM